jgi:proteasome lid subunit RPN8/RPN11
MERFPVWDRHSLNLRPVFEHARAELPRECCGLIVSGPQGGDVSEALSYRPCRNIAEGNTQFIIHPADYAAAEDAGEVLAIVHSHVCSGPQPSLGDIAACNKLALPWLIVTADGHAHWLDPDPAAPRPPLMGREFYWGVLDCGALVRDYYAEVLGIEWPDAPRGPRSDWGRPGHSFADYFGRCGFVKVRRDDVRLHDVLLMQTGAASAPNHVAVYVGDGRILHQIENRYCGHDEYGGYWKERHVMTARHQTLC